MKRLTTVALVVGLSTGCGWFSSTPAPGASDPATVAALAKQVRAEPARADHLLREAGWTRARFEAVLFEIAEDPEKTDAYLDALRD